MAKFDIYCVDTVGIHNHFFNESKNRKNVLVNYAFIIALGPPLNNTLCNNIIRCCVKKRIIVILEK